MAQGRNYKDLPVVVTASWAQVLPSNAFRKALTIFNSGSTAVQYGITEAGGITIPAGQGVTFAEPPLNALGAKAAGGGNLVIWES